MQVAVDVDKLRSEIQEKYADVALTPEKGFHFHTGYRLTEMLDYSKEMIERLPGSATRGPSDLLNRDEQWWT